MSIIYCEKHDLRWDSDKLEECSRCETEDKPQGEQERHDWWKAKFEEAERLYLDCNETRGKLAHQLIMQGEAGE